MVRNSNMKNLNVILDRSNFCRACVQVVHYSLGFTAYKTAGGGVFLRCGTLSLGYNCTSWLCAKMVSTDVICKHKMGAVVGPALFNLIPESLSSNNSLLIILHSSSWNRMNIHGIRGSPCLNPLLG